MPDSKSNSPDPPEDSNDPKLESNQDPDSSAPQKDLDAGQLNGDDNEPIVTDVFEVTTEGDEIPFAESLSSLPAENDTPSTNQETGSSAMTAEPVDESLLSEDEIQFIIDDHSTSNDESTLGPEELTVKNIQLGEDKETVASDSETSNETKPGDDAKKQSAAPPVVSHKPPLHWQIKPESQLARESISSIGGAVASVVLGSLALIGAFVTSFSAINAVLGFILGVWGLQSPRKRLAGIGLALCAVGFFIPITFGTIQIHQLWTANKDAVDADDPFAETSDF